MAHLLIKFISNNIYYTSIILACVLCALSLCCCSGNPRLNPSQVLLYKERQIPPSELAFWFAPRLYINPAEPYNIRDTIVFIHPEKPLIAYHIIWEDDSFGGGLGKESDRETMWVEYDPISLKLMDIWTLWHRGLLHTSHSVIQAKRHDQRPKVFVQWGQHGMMPEGWDKLATARPKVELRLHYTIASSIQTGQYTGSKNVESLRFTGSYSDYVNFSEFVDLRQYINPEKVIIAADSNSIIQEMLSYTVSTSKQPWPY